jgi:hypothetical protein
MIIKCIRKQIPFRPEWLLIENTRRPVEEQNDFLASLMPASNSTGRNIKSFKFHLAPEAVALIREQDPTVGPEVGYCEIKIKFDAMTSSSAMMEVSHTITDSMIAAQITTSILE